MLRHADIGDRTIERQNRRAPTLIKTCMLAHHILLPSLEQPNIVANHWRVIGPKPQCAISTYLCVFSGQYKVCVYGKRTCTSILANNPYEYLSEHID